MIITVYLTDKNNDYEYYSTRNIINFRMKYDGFDFIKNQKSLI